MSPQDYTTVKVLKPASSFLQPQVLLVQDREGRKWILKDFSSRFFLVRWLWGSWVLRREARVYGRLQGIEGVPALGGLVKPSALLIEYLEAPPLSEVDKAEVTEEFFGHLRRLVNVLHEREVGHGDVRKKNVLFVDEQRPVLIDFASAQIRGRGFFSRWLFQVLCRADRFNLAHLVERYNPDWLTAEERELLASPPVGMRVGRFLRKKIYRPFIKPKRWRRRWQRLKAKLRNVG